jgi:CheY-like chemotaxis protein
LNHCSVLVVDDDPSIRDSVSEILGLEGYAVQTATDGVDALRRVEAKVPSVVLLDMRMPVLDGWGFARAFRAKYNRLSAILVMTAARDARQWAEEIGAEGYLAKPFDLVDLLAAVERHCGETPPKAPPA